MPLKRTTVYAAALATVLVGVSGVALARTATPAATAKSAKSAAPAAAAAEPIDRFTPGPPHPAPAPGRLPLSYPTGDAREVVTVVAAPGSTRATLQRWTYGGAAVGWRAAGASVPAWVGANGISPNAREGLAATPAGSFPLKRAFGRMSNPGTRLGYTRTTPLDWWNGDSRSAGYNTHQRCAAASCPFNTAVSENLYEIGAVYDYAVVIDYNVSPAVPGRGSAFFWHVTNHQPTGGCVAVERNQLTMMMRWLQPSMHPRILMGTRG